MTKQINMIESHAMSSEEDQQPRGRGAPVGNTNAAKEDGLDAVQTLRCKKTELATWRAAARIAGIKLPVWIRQRLNLASGHEAP